MKSYSRASETLEVEVAESVVPISFCYDVCKRTNRINAERKEAAVTTASSGITQYTALLVAVRNIIRRNQTIFALLKQRVP